MTAPTPPQFAATDDRQLSPADRRRKHIQRKRVWAQYSQTKTSPLGADHKALLLHRLAQSEANKYATQLLDHHLALVATYEKAQAMKHSDPLQAQALMQQARVLAEQGNALQIAYETASQAHAATMGHVLATANAYIAQQKAVRKVAEVLYALNVLDIANTATQAPMQLQTFTPHSTAPQIATGDASTAPPTSVANKTLDQIANYAHKGVVLTP